MTEGKVILKIKKLEKSFGGLKAVDRCSIEVKEESITGLMGPNGAGKTTFFNLITGFYKSDKGEIWFYEEEITSLPVHKVVRKGIGRTFQIPRELREMTVLENLMLVSENQKGEYIWNSLFRSRLVRDQERYIRDKALDVLYSQSCSVENRWAVRSQTTGKRQKPSDFEDLLGSTGSD